MAGKAEGIGRFELSGELGRIAGTCEEVGASEARMNQVQEFIGIIGAIAEVQSRFFTDWFNPETRRVEVGPNSVIAFPVFEEPAAAIKRSLSYITEPAPDNDYVQMKMHHLRIRKGFYATHIGFGERANVIAWHDWGFRRYIDT